MIISLKTDTKEVRNWNLVCRAQPGRYIWRTGWPSVPKNTLGIWFLFFVGGSLHRCHLRCVLGLVTVEGAERAHDHGCLCLVWVGSGGYWSQAGHPGLRQHGCLRNQRQALGLHCDEQAKPGEFHLQKILSVAPVALSQHNVWKKSLQTIGGSHANDSNRGKAAETSSGGSATISEDKHMHTHLSERQTPILICALLIL